MIKRLAIGTLVVGVLYGLALSVQHAFTPSPGPDPAKRTVKQVDDCSDQCEQRSIVERWPDGELQRCRRGCRGEPSTPPPPRETPSKISVTPTRPAKPPPIAPPQLR